MSSEDEAAWQMVAAGQRRRQQERAKRGEPASVLSLEQVSRAGRLLAEVWAAGRRFGVEPGDWSGRLPRFADLVFDTIAAADQRRAAAADGR